MVTFHDVRDLLNIVPRKLRLRHSHPRTQIVAKTIKRLAVRDELAAHLIAHEN